MSVHSQSIIVSYWFFNPSYLTRGCKVSHPRSGGVTHWLITPDDDGTPMTVCWGQNAANGELGLGPEEPKSSTKPTKNNPLAHIEILE